MKTTTSIVERIRIECSEEEERARIIVWAKAQGYVVVSEDWSLQHWQMVVEREGERAVRQEELPLPTYSVPVIAWRVATAAELESMSPGQKQFYELGNLMPLGVDGAFGLGGREHPAFAILWKELGTHVYELSLTKAVILHHGKGMHEHPTDEWLVELELQGSGMKVQALRQIGADRVRAFRGAVLGAVRNFVPTREPLQEAMGIKVLSNE
jgi:hypothetical protein